MSDVAYAAFATTVKNGIDGLNYEQQFGILQIVISAMNRKKVRNPLMTREESLRLFDKFTGSMKVPQDFDAKKEYLEYLDERYGL